jgi:hypothetical protein
MPTNFVIGQILMLLAFQEIKSHKGQVFTFPLKCAVAYSIFVFVPVAAWFYYHMTGWSEVYMRPEAMLPGWGGPAFFAQYAIGMFFGCLLAQTLIQQGRTWMVFLTLATGIFWLAGTWGFTSDQYLHVGTFAEYQAGAAKNILDDETIQMRLNIGGAIMALPAGALGYWFFKRSGKISRTWFR